MSLFYDDQSDDESQSIPSRSRRMESSSSSSKHQHHRNAIASSSRAQSIDSTSIAGTHDDTNSYGYSTDININYSSNDNNQRGRSIISETSPSRSDRTRLSTSNIFGKGKQGYDYNGDGDGDGDESMKDYIGDEQSSKSVFNGSRDDDNEEGEDNDVKQLGKIWIRERGTVDIMPWEGDLIDLLFDKLEQQQKMVHTLRSDPQTSEEEHFKLMLVQTEMERVKFLVRSYVRTRLHKIEKYSHHITLTPEIHHLLSGAELLHAQRYTELLHSHYQHSVLDSLPEWLRKMDDLYGDGLSMVTKPNRNTPVLIHCKKDCGEITLEGGERAALAKGTTHLVKYRMVEQWIKLGWAEVL